MRRYLITSGVISVWLRKTNKPPHESVVNWRIGPPPSMIGGSLSSEAIEGDLSLADALIWLGTTMKLKGEER